MRILGAVCAMLLALAGVATADRLVKTNLEVAIPEGWQTTDFFDDTEVVSDAYLFASSDEIVVIVGVSRMEAVDGYELVEDCIARMALLPESTSYRLHPETPEWVPLSYVAPAATMQVSDTSEVTMLCRPGPGRDILIILVSVMTTVSAYELAPLSHEAYEDATPMLEAIANATEWGAEPAPEDQGYVPVYTTDDTATYDTTTYIPEEETPVDEPEPEPAPRDRALRVGIGLAYLAPAQMQESGYGLAASLGYDFGSTEARLRGEARGLFGVDSSAGFWADLHAHAVVRLFGDSFDGFTLSAHGGVGFDGIGKANTEMKVTVPYAASPQLGLRIGTRVDDGAYSLDGTFAVRIDGEPGGALRVGLSRLWDGPRRLASASIRYLRYADVVGHVSLMFGFRI